MKEEYHLKNLKIKRRGPLPGLVPATLKHKITISLDEDVLQHFKSLAENPGALPYQTQINQALRQYINQDQALTDIKYKLLQDQIFLNTLATMIHQHSI
jgi:uncharacterized protein (DUF4415 family)